MRTYIYRRVCDLLQFAIFLLSMKNILLRIFFTFNIILLVFATCPQRYGMFLSFIWNVSLASVNLCTISYLSKAFSINEIFFEKCRNQSFDFRNVEIRATRFLKIWLLLISGPVDSKLGFYYPQRERLHLF